MEPKLLVLVRNLDVKALRRLNEAYRWLRLRAASVDEISVPANLQRDGWAGYCACDGSGIYNGAFGPLRRHLRQRKHGRLQGSITSGPRLIIDGLEINSTTLQCLLHELLSRSAEVIMTLRTTPLISDALVDVMHSCPTVDVDGPLRNGVELFTEVGQALRLAQKTAKGQA